MPFGLRNAAQTFQRFINEVLHDLEFCYAYIDDISVTSTTEEHYKHLEERFHRLEAYTLKLKCVFGASQVKFLGYLVSAEGTRLLPDKVRIIQDFKKPETDKTIATILRNVKLL